MGRTQTNRQPGLVWLFATALLLGGLSQAQAQDSAGGKGDPQVQTTTVQVTSPKPSLEIYGFAMLDIGQNFKQIHPDWYDTLRLTKLPAVEDEFGHDNSTFAGVRQSRLGVRSSTPTDFGDLKTIFEFELFGTGVDSGQTTFRLRHAWGELGNFGAGQVLEPVHGSGRLSELARVLGPDRACLVSQRPAALDAHQRRHQYVHGRARAAGRER